MVYFHFRFRDHMHSMQGSTFYKKRYSMSVSLGSVEQKILQHCLVSHLSLFLTCDQSNLTPVALAGCRVAKSAFVSRDLGYFKTIAMS